MMQITRLVLNDHDFRGIYIELLDVHDKSSCNNVKL